MNREEALKDYTLTIQEYLDWGNRQLEEDYDDLEKAFFGQLKVAIEQLCEKIDHPVRYLQVSLLRSPMWQDTYQVMLSAYDEEYFLDAQPIIAVFDIGIVFRPLEDVRKNLYETARNYRNKVQKYDCDKFIMDIAVSFFKKKAERARRFLWDLDKWDCIKNIPKYSRFVVKWGEHRDYSETVFLVDYESRNQEEFNSYNEKNSIDNWDHQYVYQCFDRIVLMDIAIQRKNFMFMGMRDSKIEQSVWECCMFLGASFRNAAMREVIFAGCDLSQCDFRKASLNNVRFIQCKLSGSDFREIVMEKTSFENCEMEGVLFTRNNAAYAGLDAHQLQQIIIEEEPHVFYYGRG